MWECNQHGKLCQSYVTSIVKKWNDMKITPNNIPKDQEHFKKCVRWIND